VRDSIRQMTKIRVLLVEDDPILRQLLTEAIEQAHDMVLVGTYDSAVEMLRSHYPISAVRDTRAVDAVADIAVMDIWHSQRSALPVRIPDSTEIFTFMRQVGFKVQALFVSSVSKEYVQGACYSLDPRSWTYLDKSEIKSASVVLTRIREQLEGMADR